MANPIPKITVLIPTFNRGEYLAECLDSILSQTLAASQIIVINDGSTDHTKSVCELYHKAIEYIELNQVGKPGAINAGLKKATGDYIWIFDDDDVAFPDALARFVDPLERHPEYGFSYSTFFYTATDSQTGRIGSVINELQIPDLETRGFLIPLLELNFLGGAALFARKVCYEKVGDFDPELLRSQDYEMAIRIARHFKGIRISGGPTFHYRQHDGVRGQSQDRFASAASLEKWMSYNQKFFSKFYKEIPITEYLLPGQNSNQIRHAYLQRLAIMWSKILIPEVLRDLRELSQLSDRTPFSREEILMIRTMIRKRSYHGMGTIFDHWEFFDEIRRLAACSPVIRLLRAEVFRALVIRFRIRPGLGHLRKTFPRMLRLYF